MKSLPNKLRPPSNFAAVRFVCGCFGIEEKDLAQTLERVRKNTPNPDGHFPRKLSRVMLMRAENGQGRWLEALDTLHREALYERIRRDEGKPLFSFTGKVADEIVFSLLTLYERLLPRLDLKGVLKQEIMWLLVENVFVPAIFIKLINEWRFGLGTELQSEKSWYLPMKTDSLTQKPISRVLDCWLRVAGFRTAYGVSQTLSRRKADKTSSGEQINSRWELWKKSVGRWLNGECVPSVSRLHELVEEFAEQVAWLDSPDTWKARFTLACAMQRMCDEMDAFFKPVRENSSLTLAEMLRRISDEHLVCDDGRFLAGTHSFFAARLLQRRLQEKGEWKNVVASAKPMSGSFPPEASDAEIAAFRQQMHWQMNPGNSLLEYIKARAVADGRLKHKHNPAEVFAALDAELFEIGVIELNRLLDANRKRAGER